MQKWPFLINYKFVIMKKNTLIFSLFVCGLLAVLTNCKKENHSRFTLVSPVIDRNFSITGTTQKSFASEKEFRDFIENGLKNVKFDVKMPRLKKYFKLEGQDKWIGKTYDYNPCPNNNPMGENGGHNLQEGLHTSEASTALTGLNMGIDFQVGYGVNGSTNQVTPLNGSVLLTGSGAIPTSQQNTGTTFVSGTTVSTVGSITATWTSGFSGTFSNANTNGSTNSGGFTINAGPVTYNANGSTTYSNTVTTSQTISGSSSVTAQISYEMNEDICNGNGTLKVWVNSQLVINTTLTP